MGSLIDVLDVDYGRLAAELADVAARLGGGLPAERPHHHREVLAIFDRCRGMFGAVRLLAGNGFGQEAMLLVRALITDSLMLMELASVSDRRQIEIIVGWSLASVKDLEGIFIAAQARGEDVGLQLEAVRGLRRWWNDYAGEQKVAPKAWRVNEKALAKKHNRDDYLSFRMTHHFVHGTTFAAGMRWNKERDTTVIGGEAVDPGWDDGAVLQAADSMVHAIRATAAILSLPVPRELQGLSDRLQDANEVIRAENA